jgi:hypothetical protein
VAVPSLRAVLDGTAEPVPAVDLVPVPA